MKIDDAMVVTKVMVKATTTRKAREMVMMTSETQKLKIRKMAAAWQACELSHSRKAHRRRG